MVSGVSFKYQIVTDGCLLRREHFQVQYLKIFFFHLSIVDGIVILYEMSSTSSWTLCRSVSNLQRVFRDSLVGRARKSSAGRSSCTMSMAMDTSRAMRCSVCCAPSTSLWAPSLPPAPRTLTRTRTIGRPTKSTQTPSTHASRSSSRCSFNTSLQVLAIISWRKLSIIFGIEIRPKQRWNYWLRGVHRSMPQGTSIFNFQYEICGKTH